MSATRSRITNILLVLVLLALVSLIGMYARDARGGPLDPTDQPGSTNGVRLPGTPISALPFTITEPGHYYVTRNLTAAGPVGINIQSGNVTLDLGGFMLDGANTGQIGVIAQGAAGQRSVTVRNGSVRRWTQQGFFLQFTTAENLSADNNQVGILIGAGTLTGCSVKDNAAEGVDAVFVAVSDCDARDNATGFDLSSSSLRSCSTSFNDNAGIIAVASVVESCSSSSDRWGIVASHGANVHHNSVSGSQGDGIRLVGASGESTVADNTVRFSGTTIVASGIYVENNNNRLSRNNVAKSLAAAPGIYVVGSFNTLDENSTFQNGGVGIVVSGQKNTVVRNSSLGNVNVNASTNYQISAGNNAGPVDAAAASTNPWSNTQ